MSKPPPHGPPWDLPVAEAPLAFVDLEMTGLDLKRDFVVEVCVERWRGTELEGSLETLVRPPARVGGNAHVHGIDEAALSSAPAFAEVAPRVSELLEGAAFVAHAAIYDAEFIEMEMERAGRPLHIEHYIDTLTLARRSFALPSYSLDALCKHLSLDRGRAHRAGDDVRAMREVFARCLGVLVPVSLRDLWEVRVAERRARTHIVTACEAAAEHGATVEILYRPARRPPQRLAMVVSEVRAGLDPPRVLGYLLPGRGRRELRADRILQVEAPSAGSRPHSGKPR